MSEAKENILGNSVLLAAIGMLNRGLTVLAQIAIARLLGSSIEGDAYFATETFVDLSIILVSSGISMAAVPAYLRSPSKAEARAMVGNLIVATSAVFFVVAGGIYLAAPALIDLVGPGLHPRAASRAVSLIRVMALVLLFLGPEAGTRAAFNANRIFATPDLARTAYNVVLLVGIITMAGSRGSVSIAWSMVVGSAAMASIVTWRAARTGLVGLPTLKPHPEVVSILKQMPAVLVVLGWPLVLMMIDKASASNASVGAVSTLGYATRVVLIPIGIVVLPFATATYPSIAEMGAPGAQRRLADQLASSIRSLLFVVLPVAAGLYVLRQPLVSLLFERGRFDAQATERTAAAVGFYVWSLPGLALVFYLRNAFFALDRIRSLAVVSAVSLVVAIGLNWVAQPIWRLAGVVLSTGVAAALTGVAMVVLLRYRIGLPLALGRLAVSIAAMTIGLIVPVTVMEIARSTVGDSSPIMQIVAVSASVPIATIAYALVGAAGNVPEAVALVRWGGSIIVGPRPENEMETPIDAVAVLMSQDRWATRLLTKTAPLVLALGIGLTVAITVAVAAPGLAGLETMALAGAIGSVCFFVFSNRYYDAAVFLAFALMGVVMVEPAPVDLMLAGLVPLGLLTRRLDWRQIWPEAGVNIPAGLLVVVVLCSTMLAGDLVHSARYTAITVYCVAIMYFVRLYVTSTRRAAVVASGYAAGLVVALLAVFADLIGLVPDEIVMEFWRAKGFTKDANVFGPMLVPLVIIAIDVRIARFGRWEWLARVGLLSLSLTGLLLTFSRAAWGNTILTLAIYGAFRYRTLSAASRRRTALAIAGALVGLGAFVMASGQGEFLSQRASIFQSYDSERFDAQSTGIQLGLNNTLGIGPGMSDLGELFAPHSLFIRALAETGPVGFGVLMVLLGSLYLVPLRGWDKTSRFHGISAAGLVAIAIGQLANSVLIDTLHWRHFWLILGLLWAGRDLARRRDREAPPLPIPIQPRRLVGLHDGS